MKRSDAVLIIASEICAHPPHLSFDIAQSIAEAIINRLEEENALPPEHLFRSGEKADHYLREWENE